MKKLLIIIILILSCVSLSAKNFIGFFDIPLSSSKNFVNKVMNDYGYTLDGIWEYDDEGTFHSEYSYVNNHEFYIFNFNPSMTSFSFVNLDLKYYSISGDVTSIDDFVKALKKEYPDLTEKALIRDSIEDSYLILSSFYSDIKIKISHYSEQARFYKNYFISVTFSKN